MTGISEAEIDSLFSKIRSLVSEKRYSDAISRCRELFTVWPKRHHHLFGRLAFIYEQMGDRIAALDAISEAIALKPTSPAHLDHRMVIATNLNNFEMAQTDPDRLIAVEQRRGSKAFIESARIYRAYAFINLGKTLEALKELEEINDPGPFRIDGRLWSKTDLLRLARSF